MPQIIQLKGNEDLYKEYNLLNKKGKIKVVKPNKKTQNWLSTLNQSPYYTFKCTLCGDGKHRIFILKKLKT